MRTPARGAALPEGFRIALDPRTAFRASGALATGGSPWKLVRLKDAARPFLAELRAAGAAGAVPGDRTAAALARQLLDHGMAHPVPARRCHGGGADGRCACREVTVVVPAYGRPDHLGRCLAALAGADVVVVDDGTPDPGPIARLAAAHGARLLRHPVNRGPAAARNTGLREVGTPFVALLDSDCVPEEGWLCALLPHFDDPRVAAVAPRVLFRAAGSGLLARFEEARSALDMGERPALVRPGAALGFLPTAALLVRAGALDGDAFDERLRLGEDVDFVWRLADHGWLVRYDPCATVAHAARVRPLAWARRRFEYGTSAAALADRHPGRLTPARPSPWNLAALGLLAAGRPLPAAQCSATAAALLRRRFPDTPGAWPLSAGIVATGLGADALALGHALRREWWPLGAAALAVAATRRGRARRASRLASTAMLAPLALEWLRRRPGIDPPRYAGLRLVEDAAYGSGVILSALRARSAAPLLPRLRTAARRRRAPGAR